MKSGWQVKKFGDVCELKKGKKPNLSSAPSGGNKPYLVAKYLRGSEPIEFASVSDRNSIIVEPHEIIIICDGSNSGETFIGFDGILSSTMAKIAHGAELDNKFLMYFLDSLFEQFNAAKTGSAIPHLDLAALREQNLPVPPLAEQQRIVAILDAAFDGIATVKANAEQNLQNVRALFESHLQSVFTQRGEGWIETTIGDQITLQRGFDITKDQQKSGDVPVVSSGGIKSFHDAAMVKAPGVVIGRKGTLGKVFYLENDFWPHDTTLWVKDFKGNEPRFVYYFLTGLDVKSLDSGTANPALNRNQVHPLETAWPTIELQREITATLDSLIEETQRLESLYQRKLAALDELKKSLLHQAFSGAL